jgi:hypothetical protein
MYTFAAGLFNSLAATHTREWMQASDERSGWSQVHENVGRAAVRVHLREPASCGRVWGKPWSPQPDCDVGLV